MARYKFVSGGDFLAGCSYGDYSPSRTVEMIYEREDGEQFVLYKSIGGDDGLNGGYDWLFPVEPGDTMYALSKGVIPYEDIYGEFDDDYYDDDEDEDYDDDDEDEYDDDDEDEDKYDEVDDDESEETEDEPEKERNYEVLFEYDKYDLYYLVFKFYYLTLLDMGIDAKEQLSDCEVSMDFLDNKDMCTWEYVKEHHEDELFRMYAMLSVLENDNFDSEEKYKGKYLDEIDFLRDFSIYELFDERDDWVFTEELYELTEKYLHKESC